MSLCARKSNQLTYNIYEICSFLFIPYHDIFSNQKDFCTLRSNFYPEINICNIYFIFLSIDYLYFNIIVSKYAEK